MTLTAEPRIVADYDTGLPGWRIAGGRYRVALAQDAALKEKVEATGVEAITNTPEEFAAVLKRDIGIVGRIVKAAGIQPE